MKHKPTYTNRWLYACITAIFLLFSPLQTMADKWTTFYTDILVAGGDKGVRYQLGWWANDQDLNDGAGGEYIYLLHQNATTSTPSTGFITDLKIVKRNDSNPEQEFTENGVKWTLAPCRGSDNFVNSKGDLNCKAGGRFIYLYYTRDEFSDSRVVRNVYFNEDSNGSVGGDLNEGAGGDFIYMHVTHSNKGEGLFDSPGEAFTYTPNGRNALHFKLLTSDFDPFRTLHSAVYSLMDEDGNKTPIFTIGETSSSSSNDYAEANFQNNMAGEAQLFLTNSCTYSPKYYQVTGNEESIRYYREDGKGRTTGNAYAELDWYYPAKYSNKNMRLVVDAELFFDGGHTEAYTRYIGNIEFDETMVETYDPVIGTESGEEGMIKIPCVSDHPINWLQAIYTDDNGNTHKMDRVAMKENSYAGFVLLPATVAHKQVTINAGITTASWDKSKLPQSSWPTSNVNTLTLNLENVAMLHDSRELTAEMDSLGNIDLKWKISNVNFPDIVESDQFFVQRSLTGRSEDFEIIGTVMFDIDEKEYSYKDSLFISSLTPELIDKKLGIPVVRYRVLRASTAELWGTTINPAISHVVPCMATLTLLKPTNAKAEWSNREEQKALVTWDYLPNDATHNYVWDSRAEMRLEVEMRNRENQLVGTLSTLLSKTEIAARKMEITLHRSCVKYKLKLTSVAKKSPIGRGTKELYVTIGSHNDILKFTDRVGKGERTLNAILINDINSSAYIGFSSEYSYQGLFNGNGHKWETNISSPMQRKAIFKYVGGDALICNLRVTGQVDNSNEKFAAGVVANVKSGAPVILNCISSVNINAKGSGDATHGGLVALLDRDAHVTIDNCLFNGTINLDQMDSSGGLVGWHYGSSMAKVSNSYYGGNASTANACYTLVRSETQQLNFIEDTYYKNTFGEPQGLQSDKAPDNDCWKNGEPVLHTVSFSTPVSIDSTMVQLPDSAFYYQNSGKLVKGSLSVTPLQSSALLEWATDGGAIDYFIVKRRDQGKSKDAWETIGTQITETNFEDKLTAPMHKYDYCVLAANDCEGISYQSTDTITGRCFDFCTVEGYLRFPDGSGVPGQEVVIESGDGGKSFSKTVLTDESGFFACDSLPYWGTELSGVYRVTPNLNGYTGFQSLTFGTMPGTNFINDVVFYIEDNVKFSGFVLYTGTSIPVQGVSFLVDGHEVHTEAGKVTSNFEGAFSFRMLPGMHVIQAVKNGHTFYQRGYYYEGGDTTKLSHNFVIDKGGVYFYDDTRVKLIGRVAGGKDQEAFPLDNSLSRNNLGDDLRMVFTLEGDRSSRLVWDIQDEQLKETDEVFRHQSHDGKDYHTNVHTTLYRKVIRPDERTGEYQVWLPPVKWKIEQINAQGYATLFQDGHTNDVIDLSDSLTLHTDTVRGKWRSKSGKDLDLVTVKYHAQYNRIYHAPVSIEYNQIGYDNFSYLGNRYYTAKGLDGTSKKIELVRPVRKPNWPVGRKDSLMADYTFGYPVFNIDRKYPIRISATEKYYYNNGNSPDSLDVVRLSGGKVTIQNGFVSSTHREVIELDSAGQYLYQLSASQIPYLITGEQATRTVTMTLQLDGTYYEAEPLKAYILNIAAQAGSRDVISMGMPILVDVLRDPPGCNSSAKLSKGSTLTSSFTLDMKMQRGVKFNFGVGTSWDTWKGVGVGVWSRAENVFDSTVDLIWNTNSQAAYSYTMTANTDISTSSDKKTIGADGDVYMGLNTNVIMKPAIAIRAINDSIYKTMQGEEKAGRLLVIAKGTDSKTGEPLYLVRSETMAVGQKLESTFAHSQQYITKQLLPQLEEQCRSLMFTGTASEAKRQADATGKPVYLSLRDKDDPMFAVANTRGKVELGQETWEVFYNNSIYKAQDGVNYVIVEPTNYPANEEDKVADYYQTMLYWAAIIAQNECEKLQAKTLMRNFDVDGATGMTYSEEFSTQVSQSIGKTDLTTNYRYGTTYQDAIAGIGLSFKALAGTTAKFLVKQLLKSFAKWLGSGKEEDREGQITMTGWKWHINIDPAVSCDFTPKYTGTQKFTRKESFTIGMDNKSHLNIDVFYADAVKQTTNRKDWDDVFFNDNFNNTTDVALDQIYSSLSDLENHTQRSRGFIYRTRGGATQRRWEDQRTTIFYNEGSILDERTKRIENPVIKMDKQSQSGVPLDEPARFKLYLTNESEQPEATYPYFNLTLRDNSNSKGAKIMMDGMPLTGADRTIVVLPGEVTEKTIEVYAGEEFDYENLRLRLGSLDDPDLYQEATFSVHYLQTAGDIAISTPGDKWIMNTDAPYDSLRGWYQPVIISGFNRNQHNFDHIEFQYKETARGDDYWTNICSFFADSTYYKGASGTKEMIPSNGNITTKFYGDGFVMEKGYDLRAVLFCRNGNGYITNASKVLSGVKDTRRPQLFGTPEPKDGVLGSGDNIIFNFTEDIEYNYLNAATNFEVKGETNEAALQENSVLLFDGKGYAESESRRNFNDKDITVEVMIKPENTGQQMPIFSHGSNGNKLQLWLTADRRLKGVVNDKTVEGKTQLSTETFTRVAIALDNENRICRIYADNLEGQIDSVVYTGSGTIIFGATNQVDVSKREHYSGRMMQARVWNRNLGLVLLNNYGNQLLTGYEMGLNDYYPMNEGNGDYAYDGAQGAHLKLHNTGWSLPHSMSMTFDFNRKQANGIRGLKLRRTFLTRDADQDYTLMFWFKTDFTGRGALLSNGSGHATDVEPADRFFIGFEADSLKYRANGQTHFLGNSFSDNQWHHYAMTMNKAHSIANIYIDFKLMTSFTTDSIGGMGGDNFYLGNMVWNQQGADNDKLHQANALSGRIDGLTLFGQALPTSLIKRYGGKGLSGEEKGLITYMDFCRQERQKNGELTLVPYPMNKVIKRDRDGNISQRNDTVFALHADSVIAYIDQKDGAPIQAYEQLRQLNFSFVGTGHQILLNIDELDSRINKRHIYATVSDIPDMNGNVTSSPTTVSLFINRNPLRWETSNYNLGSVEYGSTNLFFINIRNTSGSEHTYTIENLPKWLTVEVPSNIIGPLEEREIRFDISKDANIGFYDQILYLTDENGLSEPMALNIEIVGDLPDWDINKEHSQNSMNIVARIQIQDEIVTDSRDIVAVFDSEGHCLGKNNVDYDGTRAESLAYITVYEDSAAANRPLNFKLWHYQTGKIMALAPSETVTFRPNNTVGTTKAPIVLKAGDQYFQEIILERGWNWISLNVVSNDFRDGKGILNRFNWNEGDMIIDDNGGLAMRYQNSQWITNKGTAGLNNFMLSVTKNYRIKSAEAKVMELQGSILRQPSYRQITINNGWNSIGYTPVLNLPVTTALSDYLDEASDGDVIKSRSEFAMMTVSANGSKEWKGNLRYMKPGEGYMLYRKDSNTATFFYPFYEPNSTFIEGTNSSATLSRSSYANTMSLTAAVKGIDLQQGDRIVVLSGAEEVGQTLIGEENSDVQYISIEGDQTQQLSFIVERDGEIVAATGEVLTFESNAISGSPLQPTVISFVRSQDMPQTGWYTLQGVKLPARPQQSGVYILNGKKKVIK